MSVILDPIFAHNNNHICAGTSKIVILREIVHAAHDDLIVTIDRDSGRDIILSKFLALKSSLEHCFSIEELAFEVFHLDPEGKHVRRHNVLKSAMDATELLFTCFDLPLKELSRTYNEWSIFHIELFDKSIEHIDDNYYA